LDRISGASVPGWHGRQARAFISDEKVPAGQDVHAGSSAGAVGICLGAGGAGGAGGAVYGPSGGGGGGFVHGGGDGGGDGAGGGGDGAGGDCTNANRLIVNRYVSLACPFGDVVIKRRKLLPVCREK
jgi:hypothetical protein